MLRPSIPLPASLETTVITARQAPKKRRQGRAYHRIISGLHRDGRTFRFLTLTTKAGTRDTPAEFQRDWRVLKERLRRRGLLPAYIKVMEYTKSGLPHAHIILAGGGFLPQWWISELWHEIHGAKVVDIRLIRQRPGGNFWEGHKNVAGYLAKYMGKDPIARLAYSHGWLWKGLARTWRGCYRAGAYLNMPFEETLRIWKLCCQVGIPPDRSSKYLWIARRNPDLQRILRGEPREQVGYTSWQKSPSLTPQASVTPSAKASRPVQISLFAQR